jgi:hypothetical protein
MSKFEHQLSNGAWIKLEDSRVEEFCKWVVEYDATIESAFPGEFEERMQRLPLKTTEAVIQYLTENPGKSLKTHAEWYCRLRVVPVPVQSAEDLAFQRARESGEPQILRKWDDYMDNEDDESHYYTEYAMPDGTRKTETRTVLG